MPSNLTDSIAIAYTATDSINTSLSDTVYVKFAESKRKADDFSFTVTPKQGAFITTDFETQITFNKPILNYSLDSLYFEYDSTTIQQIPDSIFIWNNHRDKLNFRLTIDKAKIDTLISNQKKISDRSDSLPEAKPASQQQIKRDKAAPKKNLGFRLYIGKGTFISADYDSSNSVGYNYKFVKPEEVGTQEIIATSEYQSYTIQLLTEKFDAFEEVSSQKEHTFYNVPPGKYRIRILIDSNNDGVWSLGNILNNEEPEPVYIYPETLIIRADWRTKLEISF
ncbi:MAG: hypothetical protein U5K79_03930 [Cyclobacteriaceae bacterium]|nr:hypothetical protein [Cyclobacteriaceae bacterium]